MKNNKTYEFSYELHRKQSKQEKLHTLKTIKNYLINDKITVSELINILEYNINLLNKGIK